MEQIRGFLKAYERLNSSSSEYGFANWGELNPNDNLNEQIEKCLSSSNRQAEVKTISALSSPEKELQDDFIPWMFAFLGVYRSEDGTVNYSSSAFSNPSKEEFLRNQARTLVTMILDEANPEEVSRIYMGNNWCAFVFKNSERVFFLGLTSILN